MNASKKRALIFVGIPTHFKEMIRVARLLRDSPGYEPLVLISASYGGWEMDAETCRKSGISVHFLYLDAYRLAWADLARQTVEEAILEQAPDLSAAEQSRIRESNAVGGGAFSARLPAFIRPHFRRIWRRVYKGYWDLRATTFVRQKLAQLRLRKERAELIWRLWLRPLLRPSDTVTGKAAARSSKRRLDMTPSGGRRIAAFGELWEDRPELMPYLLTMRRRLHDALPVLMRKHGVRLLVVPEDNYYLNTQIFINAAHRIGAPTAIVPFTITNELEWVEGFFANPEHQVRWPIGTTLAREFPNWVYVHKDRKLIMPATEILMNEYLELTPPRPWLMNSGFADALAVAGPYMAEYYRRAGIDAAKISVTGSLADDELHAQLARADERREALYKRLGMPGGRPMLLISVPPNQLDGDGRPDCEFRTYDALLRAMLKAACDSEGWNVVLSLHPRIYRDHVKFIREFRCEVAEDDIASLVPLCSVFIASASATIRLAAAAGKPVLNYDVFRYRYTDYEDIPGILSVDDHAAYKAQVRAFTQDPDFLAKLTAAQGRFASEHAMVDGRSGERMLALFDRLTASGGESRSGS